jgi:hypothetical protein
MRLIFDLILPLTPMPVRITPDDANYRNFSSAAECFPLLTPMPLLYPLCFYAGYFL